jgi:hypothetical protein
LGKQFRALAKSANVQNVRIHDLRHAGATILMTLGVPDPIVRKVTGHRSRELERYQHLTPELRALTVNLIATELFRAKRTRKERETRTPTGTVRSRRAMEKLEALDLVALSSTVSSLPSTVWWSRWASMRPARNTRSDSGTDRPKMRRFARDC